MENEEEEESCFKGCLRYNMSLCVLSCHSTASFVTMSFSMGSIHGRCCHFGECREEYDTQTSQAVCICQDPAFDVASILAPYELS